MRLTAQRLIELHACQEGINAFKSMFPDGVEYSTELHQKLLQSELAIYEAWCVRIGFVPVLNVTVGNNAIAIAGYEGTAIAGDFGTANAGYNGIANAGDYGTANAGYNGIANAGNFGTAITGYNGIANAGYKGIATVGDYGKATAGNEGTASAGNYGTATAGNYGTANAGYYGIAAAGIDGIINIVYFDNDKKRILTGYIGENDLLPNTKYKVQHAVFVPA